MLQSRSEVGAGTARFFAFKSKRINLTIFDQMNKNGSSYPQNNMMIYQKTKEYNKKEKV